MAEYFLTTTDNPYDPVTQPELWHSFDVQKNYFTREYLARVAVVSNELPQSEYNKAVEEAIDEIIRLHPTGPYKKIQIK